MRFSAKVLTNKWAFSIPDWNSLASTSTKSSTPPAPHRYTPSSTARLIEDLTASYQGGWTSVISLHGGGSPAATKQEIWRDYPVSSKVELGEHLLEHGVLHDDKRAFTKNRKPGRCCDNDARRPGSR